MTNFDGLKFHMQPFTLNGGEVTPFKMNCSPNTVTDNLTTAIGLLNGAQNFE